MDITTTLAIPDEELHFTFARSGGPGGQNVNKVASKAVLRWDLAGNTTLPADVKERLRQRQRRRVTAEGELIIQGQRYRDQARNVEDCRERLRAMVLEVLHPPRPRKKTKPSRGSQERRLAAKRLHARRKARRRGPGPDE
jgi:ribosome-associated protein